MISNYLQSNIIINRRLKLTLTFILLFTVHFVHSAVLVKNKQWPQNFTLNVVFLDGSNALHEKIKQIAPRWLNNTNLNFRFFNGLKSAPAQTHIRISFKLQSGSQIGNHGDYLSPYATMNLFDLTSLQASDNAMKRLILHEFGHALGFEHEYLSENWPYGRAPISRIAMNCIPKMIKIGYSTELASKQCQHINQSISVKLAHTTAFDERSIMNYPMSFSRQNGTKINIKAFTNLSLLDSYSIQRWYPK